MVRLFTLFIFSLLIIPPLRAQEPAFHVIGTDQGLPGSECHSIRQDSKGYLWICTGAGLSKYDGRTFKNFTTAQGLTDNTVFDTFEDEQGRIFYTTSNSRIGYIKNDSAFTLPVTDTLAKRLNSGRRFVKSIGSYDKEHLLIATQYGFFLVDKKTLSRLEFLPSPQNVMLWIKIIDGKAYCANYEFPFTHALTSADNYSLCVESGEKKTFTAIAFDLIHVSALAVFQSLQLSDGRLLIGFWDKIITLYPGDSTSVMNLPARLLSLSADQNGGIWICLFKKGILYYPEANFTAPPQHLLEGFTPSSVCMDTEGGTWVSTESDGILYCASLNIVAYPNEKPLNGRMNALSVLPPFLVANGITSPVYLFRNKNDYRSISIFNNDSLRQPSSYLRQGPWIFAASPDGTYRLDTNFHPVKTIADSILSGSMLYNIVEGKDDCLWGIRFNELVRLCNDTTFYDRRLPARGSDVGIDRAGRIYAGTNNGLYLRTNSGLAAVGGLNCKINRLKCDPSGNLWACTDGMGLVRVDSVSVVERYNSASGLASDICYDVVFDSSGIAWIGTNNGLCRLDPVSGKISRYKTSQGLLSNEVLKLALLGNSLFISTQKGLCAADINSLHNTTVPPRIYITAVGNNHSPARQKSDFAFGENNFTFSFNGISLRDPEGIFYLYRLVGMDTAWRTNLTGEITFNNLDDGRYTFEVMAVTSEGLRSTQPARYTFTIAPPFWKKSWFLVLAAIGLAAFIFGIIALRTNYIRKKEREKTKLNKLIAEYQMSALQAQMNPHFIFNAINSIQHYILTNETQYAYDYLTKFSTLIRNVLVNSREKTISLEKELDMLGLYIQLEQRRFKNRFRYEIRIDNTIPLEEIRIPVMLIQPFAENAIWHGIMNMETTEEGKLLIGVSMKNDEVIITIEDNGVGRRRAMELKKQNHRESVGMLLSEQRLEILRAVGHVDSRIVITDLVTPQQEACGTRVELFLPLNYRT